LLETAREGIDICTARIATRTAFHAADQFLDEHVAVARSFYRRRRDTMLEALASFMPVGIRWSKPGGGFFIWIELPPELDAEELLPIAAARGVVYIPGAWCHPASARSSHHALRLNFSTLPEERIVEGVRRLGAVLAER
jgi:DNA-binding transcriptional MocR family regulator